MDCSAGICVRYINTVFGSQKDLAHVKEVFADLVILATGTVYNYRANRIYAEIMLVAKMPPEDIFDMVEADERLKEKTKEIMDQVWKEAELLKYSHS